MIRKIAAQWALKIAMDGWNPPIPSWVFETQKTALVRSEEDLKALADAKESIHIMLPKFLTVLRNRLHDKYHMNASQRGADVYFFFNTRYPVDAVVLHLGIHQGLPVLNLGWVPYKLGTKQPEWNKAIKKKMVVWNPEMTGLALMRLLREVIADLR